MANLNPPLEAIDPPRLGPRVVPTDLLTYRFIGEPNARPIDICVDENPFSTQGQEFFPPFASGTRFISTLTAHSFVETSCNVCGCRSKTIVKCTILLANVLYRSFSVLSMASRLDSSIWFRSIERTNNFWTDSKVFRGGEMDSRWVCLCYRYLSFDT